MHTTETAVCKNCGATGQGKHCYQCGQKLHTERITLHSIIHEAFHYFTHLDKGFGYTLKQLAVRPGSMQKEYVEGKRDCHQKPFSMFFLCGTICGLAYYFINLGYQRLYQATNYAEADFFRHYFVLLQAVMLPLYALVTWGVFFNARKNYAENLVLTLYTLSFVLLAFIFINALKLLFPHFEIRYLELVFLLFYNSITNLRFFTGTFWITVLKTIVVMAACYLASQAMSGVIIKIIK